MYQSYAHKTKTTNSSAKNDTATTTTSTSNLPTVESSASDSGDSNANNTTSSWSSRLGSYFSFLIPFQSASKDSLDDAAVETESSDTKKNSSNSNTSAESTTTKESTNKAFTEDSEKINTNAYSSSAIVVAKKGGTSAKTLLNKDANDTITVGDLEVLLAQIQKSPSATSSKRKKSSSKGIASTSSSSSSSSSSHVAFPQPSEADQKEIQRGTGFASGLLGMIVGITILPNLWLVGMVFGVWYGFDITKELSLDEDDEEDSNKRNAVAKFLITCGTQLARAYLKASDGIKALWFLYKTGQLSYEYYKTYETLDKKFAIQNKVDAWNKVFVKGKQQFDAWEQENEVGRKMLAGLRTAWLVEENSRMRAAGRSRYRVIQVFYDLKRSATRLLTKLLETIRSIQKEGDLETFWKGLKTDLQTEGSLTTRLGAIGAALVAVNLCGALFSLSSFFANFLAIIGAVIWPSWASDLWSRTQEIVGDLVSQGSTEKRRVSTPWEFLQKQYEDFSSGQVKQSMRKNNRKRPNKNSVFSSKRKKRNNIRKNKQTFWFGRTQTRRGDTGTWGNFRRTRY